MSVTRSRFLSSLTRPRRRFFAARHDATELEAPEAGTDGEIATVVEDVAPAEGPKIRVALFLFSVICVCVPFLIVTFPPSADLAQHVCQVRLFAEAFSDPRSPYVINWITPYNLVYVVVGAAYAVLDPITSGKIALLALATLWIGAVHYLAWSRQRSAATATLVSIFVFNHTLYWGFLNFMFGWPFFALWFVLTSERTDRGRWRHALAVAFVAFLLFFAHALWFAFALGWLGVATLAFRPPLKTTLYRAIACLPSVAVAIYWYVGFSRTWYAATESGYLETPLERLTSLYVVHSALGGIHGPIEPVFFLVIVAWVAAAYWSNRGRLKATTDARLLLCGLLLLPIVFFAYHRFQNTIFFAQRWMPVAAVLLALAAPHVRVSTARARVALAAALLLAYSLATSVIWYGFDRGEMSGLTQSLAALPENPRLMGLAFIRRSDLVTGQPFIQAFAYGQALRGGELNFSFARFPQSLVVDTRPAPWTNALEWYPDRVTARDLDYFDYILVNGTVDVHERVVEQMPVDAVTTEGRWRLYHVRRGAAP